VTLPPPDEWPVADPFDGPVADLLAERVRSTPDATAVVDADRDGEWTYAAFDDYVSRLAGRLESHAVGDRLGSLLGTGVAFAGAYFAAGRRGASVVPLNPDLPAERLRAQAERTAVSGLVCRSDTETLAATVAPERVPVTSLEEPGGESTDAAAPQRNAAPAPVERQLDAERVVLFTSGTTGEPKGVRLTAGNLVASAVGSAARLGVEPGDRWLAPLPTDHMGGLAPLVRSTLYGTTTVVQRSFDADATARVLAAHDVTGVSLVPTMLSRLLDAGWTPPPSLRFVLLGGAPAGEALLDRALGRDVPVYPTYGTTETASQVATATPAEVVSYPGTVGRPLDGTEVVVVPDGGDGRDDPSPLPPGERGELVVSGPTVSPGYLDPDATAAAFDSRGVHTGDLGYADADGRLWVLGRVDDRIVTGGENVAPDRVVAALTARDDVADAAVVGLPDEEWGERVAALVVPDGADLSPTDLLDRVRDRLADYEVPKTVAVADTLPRTASGTVDREAVREQLANDGT